MKLPNVAFHLADRSLIPEDLKSLPRASKRLMEVLVKGSPLSTIEAPRSWSLDSCLSPIHFLASESDSTRIASTEFDVTRLESPFDPQSKVTSTGEKQVLPSDIVFRSVGYKSVALAGFAEAGIQFDQRRGIVSNDGLGRVVRLLSGQDQTEKIQEQVPGLYCAGWVKRGPTGVIASTMTDAFTTADAIVQDWLSGADFLKIGGSHAASGWEGVAQDPTTDSASHAIGWDQWQKIDKEERSIGQSKGKEREKFTHTADMLSIVR